MHLLCTISSNITLLTTTSARNINKTWETTSRHETKDSIRSLMRQSVRGTHLLELSVIVVVEGDVRVVHTVHDVAERLSGRFAPGLLPCTDHRQLSHLRFHLLASCVVFFASIRVAYRCLSLSLCLEFTVGASAFIAGSRSAVYIFARFRCANTQHVRTDTACARARDAKGTPRAPPGDRFPLDQQHAAQTLDYD